MIQVLKVSKKYLQGKQEICALNDVSFGIEKGEFLSIMGPSGSGKSTLLNLIGGLDQPSAGEIFIDGSPLHGISDDALTLIRRKRVGFIFQFFNLLPILTAAENVGLPLLLDGVPFSRIREKAIHLLESVGLGSRAEHRPDPDHSLASPVFPRLKRLDDPADACSQSLLMTFGQRLLR